MKNFLFVIVFLMIASSCQTVVDLDLTAQESKLVVNSLIVPDSLFTVNVSSSLSMLDPRLAQKIDYAKVTIFEDEVEVETIENGINGVYKSSVFKPSGGKKYRIKVNAEGFQEVYAETTIPAQTAISKSEYKDPAGTSPDGRPYKNIKLYFLDSPSDANYYSFQGKCEYWIREGRNDSSFQVRTVILSAESPTIEEGGSNLLLLKDELFSGKEMIVSLNFSSNTFQFAHDELIRDRSIYQIFLKTVSKEYYEYYRRLDDHFRTKEFSFFAGEPVILFSNIENGYGIFAGYSFNKIVVHN